jgi:hypothetical protein
MKPIKIVATALTLLAGAQSPLSASTQSGQSLNSLASQPPAAPAPTVAAPSPADAKPRDFLGLHNVVAYYANFLSGSVPEGDAGFDTLKGMGIKTIISVDGAEPDLAAAKARGIRYIHLPIGYNGFDEQRKLELTRATRDAMKDGPVYIHCHHGKHRSAGAAAAIAASLGWMTPEQGVARMKVSGTAPNYKGLYTCAAESPALDADVIDAVPASFPEISRPAGLVKSMVEIDEAFDHLKLIEKAGWKTPADHPDLVPVSEAGRIADLYRLLETNDRVAAKPADFLTMLKQAGAEAQAIEDLLAAPGRDAAKLADQFKLLGASCKDCHAKYRD